MSHFDLAIGRRSVKDALLSLLIPRRGKRILLLASLYSKLGPKNDIRDLNRRMDLVDSDDALKFSANIAELLWPNDMSTTVRTLNTVARHEHCIESACDAVLDRSPSWLCYAPKEIMQQDLRQVIELVRDRKRRD